MQRLRPLLESLPILAGRPFAAYGLAILLSGIAFLLRMALNPYFPPGFPFLTFFPAVILSSFLFGRGPGIAAGIVCGLTAWYFFIPPYHSFALVHGALMAMIFYLGVIGVDIAVIYWMQQANAQLHEERERSRQLAANRELLFSELQHRVSNNLQMAGAILHLQRREVADPSARQVITDAADKLQLIGKIQRKLYSTEGEQLALGPFLTNLIDDLVAAGGNPGIRHQASMEDALDLPPDAAIPVALIVAEALANALEHGFAQRKSGLLRVEGRRRGDGIELVIEDNGAGLPPGFDLEKTTSLGLRIMRSLAAQLQGSLVIAPTDGGTRVTLHFPCAPSRR